MQRIVRLHAHRPHHPGDEGTEPNDSEERQRQSEFPLRSYGSSSVSLRRLSATWALQVKADDANGKSSGRTSGITEQISGSRVFQADHS